MNAVILGVVITLVAGVLNGSFASPTKYARKWKWENIWAVWAVFALFLTIWPTAILTVPDLFSLYGLAGTGPLLLVIAFGLGNGVAQIFFGLGVAAIGLSARICHRHRDFLRHLGRSGRWCSSIRSSYSLPRG